MKAKNLNLLFFCVLLHYAPISQAQNQSRSVDWIHGLGGNSSSLQEVATHHKNTRPIVFSHRGDYPTQNGIEVMAILVRSYTGGTNSIGIGHSMGGAAIRHITIDNNNHWLGVVTLGSPLRGAQIAASGTNGTNAAYVDNGLNRMMAGPGVGAGSAPPLFPGLGLKIQPSGILGELFSA